MLATNHITQLDSLLHECSCLLLSSYSVFYELLTPNAFDCSSLSGIWHRIHSTVIAIWLGFRIGCANVDSLVPIALHQQKFVTFQYAICHRTNSNAWVMPMRAAWAKAIVHHHAPAPAPLYDAHGINWRKSHAEFPPKHRNCIWNRMKSKWFIRTASAIWNRCRDCMSMNTSPIECFLILHEKNLTIRFVSYDCRDLSNNQISVLSNYTFSNLTKLSTLYVPFWIALTQLQPFF